MGSFIETLKGGAAGAIVNAGSSLLGGVLDGLGIGPASQQYKRQKKLMQHQYQLNEQAAQEAFKRQLELYNLDYDKHTYAAMRKQMEDAGLSIGLMHGGGGSAGVGGGSTGSVPAASVSGGNVEQRKDMPIDPLTIMRVKDVQASIKLKEAEAKRQESESRKIDEELPLSKEKLRNEATKIWQENIKRRFENIVQDPQKPTEKIWEANGILHEEFEVGGKSMTIIEMGEKIRGMSNQASLWEKMTNTEQQEYEKLFAETSILKIEGAYKKDILEAELDKIRKEARKLAVELGDEYTWRSVMLDVCTLIGAVTSAANALSIGKALFGKDKKSIKKLAEQIGKTIEEGGGTAPKKDFGEGDPDFSTIVPGL